jgi:thiol-disulfide isomerase/thioredoxin
MGAPTLESMVAASTPLEIAIGSGRPTVMEFYGNACPHCHDAARQLRSVEETAIRSLGFNWVMINTDDPSLAPVWNMYHVDELPHFEFFNARGDEVGFEVGQVQVQRIEDRLKQAAE